MKLFSRHVDLKNWSENVEKRDSIFNTKNFENFPILRLLKSEWKENYIIGALEKKFYISTPNNRNTFFSLLKLDAIRYHLFCTLNALPFLSYLMRCRRASISPCMYNAIYSFVFFSVLSNKTTHKSRLHVLSNIVFLTDQVDNNQHKRIGF